MMKQKYMWRSLLCAAVLAVGMTVSVSAAEAPYENGIADTGSIAQEVSNVSAIASAENIVQAVPGADVVNPQIWKLPGDKTVTLPETMKVFDALRIQRAHSAMMLRINTPEMMKQINESIHQSLSKDMDMTKGSLASLGSAADFLSYVKEVQKDDAVLDGVHVYQLQAFDDVGYHTAYVGALGLGPSISKLVVSQFDADKLDSGNADTLKVLNAPYSQKALQQTLREIGDRESSLTPEMRVKHYQEIIDMQLAKVRQDVLKGQSKQMEKEGLAATKEGAAMLARTDTFLQQLRVHVLKKDVTYVDSLWGPGLYSVDSFVEYLDGFAVPVGMVNLYIPQEKGLLEITVYTNGVDTNFWDQSLRKLWNIKKVGI